MNAWLCVMESTYVLLSKVIFSHKYKKAYVWYEVGICIHACNIMQINGPYECGMWHNISIVRNALISSIAKSERFEANNSYIMEAPLQIKRPYIFVNPDMRQFTNDSSTGVSSSKCIFAIPHIMEIASVLF